MTPRRRRGLLLLSLALASGGLAASQVRERERDVDEKLGPRVAVVVAARDLPADEPLRPGDVRIVRAPARYVPTDALPAAGGRPDARLAGARPAVTVAAGSYLTAGVLADARGSAGDALRHGERAVEVPVRASGDLAGAGPGARVDVLVSTERAEGAGRTFVALEDVELLALRAGDGALGDAQADGGAAPAGGLAEGAGPTALATLRVTARQAVYLTAAATFARELRLLLRPPGDRRRTGPVAVGEGDL